MTATVFIVFHTIHHHIYKLSLEVQKGLEAAGVTTKLFQVQETLPEEVLTKMKALPKPDVPVITVDQLAQADGIMFGFGTRFGMVPAQMKNLWDATGQLWAKRELEGKFVGTFFSTGSQHGGQETTAYNAVPFFAHHGMMYVPFGFPSKHMSDNSQVIGGSPYGAVIIGNGERPESALQIERDLAKLQGENFGKIVATYIKGKQALEQ
ncbi:NAD(P)H:quinone oxidoreductase, type IV [Lichtheimia hyalospora FSU 10163]|nr:NAD(P)H:quinone oxidoreductase, type IV [Lichtheimia hyalospora FSU 10163]